MKKMIINNKKTILLIISGLLTGFINGLFGGGGGMILVPFLSMLINYETKEAHATAILVILPLSILSGLLYSVFGQTDFSKLLPVSIGVTIGGVVGAFLLKKIKSKWITYIFSAVMLIAGVKMLFF